MIENLSSPSINDIIFYASSLMPNILDSYKSLIVCEIKQQIGDTSCNLSDLFYRITKFPFYSLSKMIQVIKYKKQSITIDNFINFLFDLFACADLNKRIELLFNILDFDNDNIVNIMAQYNVNVLDYINYLVGCMSNTASKDDIIRNSTYYITYNDADSFNNNGAYIKINEVTTRVYNRG